MCCRCNNKSSLGGVLVSVLAVDPKVAGSNPAKAIDFFKDDKNPQHNFLRKES
jgi:hypothetical protein